MHVKYLARKCKIANDKVLSYVESVCNHVDFGADSPDYSYHQFFQVVSLYNDMLFQSIDFPDMGRRVEVNYVLNLSKIIYAPKVDIHATHWSPPDILEFKGKLLDLDYPKLEKIRNKISVLIPFL
jgi:hypothetical protein